MQSILNEDEAGFIDSLYLFVVENQASDMKIISELCEIYSLRTI